MDSKEIFEIVVVGAVLFGVGYVIYKSYNNKDKTRSIAEDEMIITGSGIKKSKDEVYKELLNRLEKDTESIKEKAIRFYITNLVPSYNFSYEEESEIFEKYPKEFSNPYLPAYDDLYSDEIDIFKEILQEKMRVAGYEKTQGLLPKDAYENMILEQAEKEAKRILDEYKLKFSKENDETT